jgi:predicted outer membrane repeat protein
LLLLAFAGLVPDARCQDFGPGSAVNLDGTDGYVQAPSGVWFSGDFTIEGWVFVRSYNSWSRLIDFANGPNNDNVYLALSFGATGYPVMGVFTNNGNPTLKAGTLLPTNQWVHLAATLSGTTGTIYINGIPVGSGPLNVAPNVVRTNNYIGRSNYSTDGHANAIFDEVRIWNVARTQAQIQSTMHEDLSANTPNLVALWEFDEDSGTNTVEAVSGQESYLVGGVTWTNSGVPFIPYLSVSSPTSVPGSSETLSGVVNPGNLDTGAWFEWGATTNYGNMIEVTNLSATNADLPISSVLSNFSPTTPFHYALVATNSVGTNVSADYVFQNVPAVTTLADDGSPGSLRYVVNNAVSGEDIIFVTNGTITLTNEEIDVTNDVTLSGPGVTNLAISGNNASRVFYVSSGVQANVSGLTICKAQSTLYFDNGYGYDPSGGGILNAGTLTLSNCDINDCTAMAGANGTSYDLPGGPGGNAGGICNYGSLSLFACTLSGNKGGAGGQGWPGQIGEYSGGTGGAGGSAGAVYNSGTLFVANCTFNNNAAGSGGGGGPTLLYLGGGLPPITVSVAPSGPAGPGGAIYNTGTATLSLCTFDSNTAGGDGGGIYSSGLATLTACTITRNTAGAGGGVYNTYEFAADNSLFADNTASGSPDYSGSFSSEGYNLIGNNSGSFGFFVGDDDDIVGTSNAPINPQIAPLANNGGPTLTVALLPGSPAIDAGDDDLLSMGITTDQRGLLRKSGAHVDIGAYETLIGTRPVLTRLAATNQTFGIAFTNTPYAVFSILTSTNLALPLADWTVLGTPAEILPGQFEFIDTSATNPAQFYRVVSP